MDLTKTDKEYRFLASLRPFSFVVACVTCGLGWVLAAHHVDVPLVDGLGILLGGLLLQAGVNLINDYADLHLYTLDEQQRQRIQHHFIAGLSCFVMAAGVAVHFIIMVGLPFLILCIIGLLGALGYTLHPINYKSRGLGVVLVFWLMGVLMVSGSYTALTAVFSWYAVGFSIPVSCLVAALLLSNELRDFEADRADGIATMTVRMGYTFGQSLFFVMIGCCFVATLVLTWVFMMPILTITLLSLWGVKPLLNASQRTAPERYRLPPYCGRLLMLFGGLYLSALWVAPYV